MSVSPKVWVVLVAVAAGILLSGCGDGPTSGGAPTVEPPPSEPTAPRPPAGECDAGPGFDGTFHAIQEIVFDGYGCTEAACHGSAGAGGLSLLADVAHRNLVGAEASLGGRRVRAGSTRDSLLWMKLAAATQPDRYTVAGSAMPVGRAPVTEDLLELLRLWIFAGAPEFGTVDGTQRFIDGCLPDPAPLDIAPLEPPPAGEGIQFVMPPFPIAPGAEVEVCFAAYYDFRDQVPADALDETGEFLRWGVIEAGQDPQSHHLQLLFSGVAPGEWQHPAFGAWTCKGGEAAGESCDPLDLGSCGNGLCGSEVTDSIACGGFGPPNRMIDGQGGQFVAGNAGQPRERRAFPGGLYAEIPVAGVYFWNSHAFNLTTEVASMDARFNFRFADRQDFPIVRERAIDFIFAPNNLPFTRERFCADYVAPRGARMFMLSSHTHGRGEHFTIEGPDGVLLYENFLYNEPVEQYFDPPLVFDAENPAERTLRYCGVFNNGLDSEGRPDPSRVTRRSRTPPNALAPCVPVACAEGRIGEPCGGVGDDAVCDTTPGAGDGFCDACRITGGVSTENEMFILIGQYYLETADE